MTIEKFVLYELRGCRIRSDAQLVNTYTNRYMKSCIFWRNWSAISDKASSIRKVLRKMRKELDICETMRINRRIKNAGGFESSEIFYILNK